MTEKKEPTLLEMLKIIQKKKFVDLTHSFEPGFPNSSREILYSTKKGVGTMGEGFFVEKFTHVGQWGTHCDPPNHFFEDLKSIDQFDVKEMLLELVIIDISKQAEKDPDYTVTMEDVKKWEKKHGEIPKGCFVGLRSDWSKKWPSSEKMCNKDDKGVNHWPGWSLEVLKFLFEKRGIKAMGHETTDTDPGKSTSKGDFSCESYVMKSNHFQIELLDNLREVPEKGAVVVVTFPKPKGGSGFPARVFAILP